jgi:hypothetical protein
MGISAHSTNDIWAVGFQDTGQYIPQTLTEHWDGSQWSVVPSPNDGSGDNSLTGVTALSPNDVWAVGSSSAGLIEHWDGSQWSIVSQPNLASSFTGITAISASNIWAVGYTAIQDNPQMLIEHWDGIQWSVVSSPNPGGMNKYFAVAAISARNIWAVGFYANGGVSQTLTEHWDGTQWSIVPSPNAGSMENYFLGVARIPGTKQLSAVGDYFIPNRDPEILYTTLTLVESYS